MTKSSPADVLSYLGPIYVDVVVGHAFSTAPKICTSFVWLSAEKSQCLKIVNMTKGGNVLDVLYI